MSAPNLAGPARREERIVLFDGDCNLCAGSVRFIIRRDPKRLFAFAALQSQAGRQRLENHGLPGDEMGTFVLIEGGRPYTRSDAVLRIARRLSGLWPILSVFRFLPRAIRDARYNFIS
ncbi:MAG: DCC1-like thiol-disulfide oxidoreductase family protein [Kiritimatiellia bacterium]